jgi:hypothetical protein
VPNNQTTLRQTISRPRRTIQPATLPTTIRPPAKGDGENLLGRKSPATLRSGRQGLNSTTAAQWLRRGPNSARFKATGPLIKPRITQAMHGRTPTHSGAFRTVPTVYAKAQNSERTRNPASFNTGLDMQSQAPRPSQQPKRQHTPGPLPTAACVTLPTTLPPARTRPVATWPTHSSARMMLGSSMCAPALGNLQALITALFDLGALLAWCCCG